MHLNMQMTVKRIETYLQTDNSKFQENKNCLHGNDFQKECEKYLFRQLNYGMCLQQKTETSLSAFKDKRCYEKKYQKYTLELILLNGYKSKRKFSKQKKIHFTRRMKCEIL